MSSATVQRIRDPATETFSTAGSLGTPRSFHTATLLRDGRVLVVGGDQAESGSAEIWDPLTMQFSPLTLADGRSSGIATTLLRDGRVLIVGGYSHKLGDIGDVGPIPPIEVWDPATGGSRAIGSSVEFQTGQSATTLPDGRVLLVGGTVHVGSDQHDVADARTWDPATESFTPTGTLGVPRSAHSAFLLPDGSVLIEGGTDAESLSAEIWDPATHAFDALGSIPDTQAGDVLAMLPDGRFLVIGVGREATIWDPRTGGISPAGSRAQEGFGSVVASLPDGRVLVVGGEAPQPPPSVERGCVKESMGWGCPIINTAYSTAELWSPAVPVSATPTH